MQNISNSERQGLDWIQISSFDMNVNICTMLVIQNPLQCIQSLKTKLYYTIIIVFVLYFCTYFYELLLDNKIESAQGLGV